MRFRVLSRGEVVGYSELPFIDAGMGIVRGIFHPNECYATIQTIIRSRMMALDEFNSVALEQALERIRELELRIQSAEGESLECDVVFIEDFIEAEALDGEAIEIAVTGFSTEVLQKFWPDQWNVN